MVTKSLCVLWGTAVLIAATGCGTVSHTLRWEEGYLPQTGTLVEVGPVKNETGETFDVNVEQMLADAFAEALREQQMLWTGAEGRKLVLTSKIVEYKKGSSFKRWLLPGWGTTVLTVQSDLREGDVLVGSAQARRTVSFGGFYTVGAWRTIFANIARDVVKDLRSQTGK